MSDRYTAFEKAKEYTKLYTLEPDDEIVVKQEDGYLGYLSAGTLATTGSNIFIGGQIIDGNLTVVGGVFANTYNVETISVSHYSASTNFGLDIDDIHTFTGSLKITGSLNVIGSTTTLGNTTISGGIFVSGGISGQINATNDIVSSSAQITTLGFASGSYETTGRNIVSSSAQITTLGFATTGSTNFVGEIIVSGSLLVSGSDTLTSIGKVVVSGSLLVSGSTTQIGNNTLIGNTTLSGSIEVSGSQIFRGIQTTTGSQFITGSSTQIGNNTLTGDNTITGINTITGSNYIFGNTVMSGSLEISGSQTRYGVTKNIGTWELTGSMFTSGSTKITGDTTIGGNLDLSGSIRVSGSFTGSIQIDGDLDLASPHNFYRWGNKLFNYGQFSDTTSQSGSANVAYPMKLNTTDISLDVSIVSGSRIYVANTGLYNIQFSAQLHTTTNEVCDFSVWFAMTGSQTPNSNTDFSIEKATGGGFETAALNYLTPISSGSYVEIYWSNTTGNGILQYKGTQTNPTRPATPSVIVTVSQVA